MATERSDEKAYMHAYMLNIKRTLRTTLFNFTLEYRRMQIMKARHEQNDMVPLNIRAMIMAKNFGFENIVD